MRHHDMIRGQIGRHPLHHLKQRVIVGDENLDVIAELRDLRRRAYEIRYWPRRPIPNEDMESAFPQVRHDPLANDAQAQHSNIFPCPTRHFLNRFLGDSPVVTGRRLKITANPPRRNAKFDRG
jgi:hypothetical protein